MARKIVAPLSYQIGKSFRWSRMNLCRVEIIVFAILGAGGALEISTISRSKQRMLPLLGCRGAAATIQTSGH